MKIDPLSSNLLNGMNFYETINLLSQQVSQTYKAYTSADEQFHELLDELMIGVFIIDTQDGFVC